MRYTTAGIKCSIIDVPAHDKRSPLRKDRTSSIDRIVGASIAHIEEGDSSGLYNEKKRLATTVYNGEYRYYEKLGFTDYAPKIFQNIRELCGIDNEMYTQSFTDTLLERASEGKSGMLFYFTSDRKYLVKTMTKKEHSFLLKMLPLYHQYLLKQPNTLLCRFLGCHSMQLPVGWNKMFFIVMENVLSVGPVHERYDLKGNLSQSHFSHEPRRYKSLKNSSGMTETQPLLSRANSRTSLWYDTDFISRRSCLQVNSSTRANMLAQVTSDCRFLQQMGVMDYSCLLGIRNYENPMDKVLLDKLPRNAVVSEDRKKIYFLGEFLYFPSFTLSRT
jgi:1-phosphatidylinositol-4-phosphate 5-kinase